jgi:hypothetical protein
VGRPPVNAEIIALVRKMARRQSVDIERCPVCQQGVLHRIAVLAPAAWDTS